MASYLQSSLATWIEFPQHTLLTLLHIQTCPPSTLSLIMSWCILPATLPYTLVASRQSSVHLLYHQSSTEIKLCTIEFSLFIYLFFLV